MKKLKLFLFVVVILTGSEYVFSQKKGLLAKLKDEMNPPGKLSERNIDLYYMALSKPDPSDTASVRMINNPDNYIEFIATLSKYDERNGGFYLAIGRYNLPVIKSNSSQYWFYMDNIQNFRFLPMNEESIRKGFSTSLASSNVNLEQAKKGGQTVIISMYMNLDTAYINKQEVKLISGSVNRLKVEWRYGEYSKRELIELKEPITHSEVPFYTNIEETPLFKFLNDYPFYTDEDWPRISITITSFPKEYQKENFNNGEERAKDLIKCTPIIAKAVIWQSKTKKIIVPEFTFFPADFRRLTISSFDTWGLGSVKSVVLENTGYKRTEGPTPPQHPLPQTPIEHKAYFETASSGRAAIADILNKIGYDSNKSGDRRVWFNIQEE